ncbi:MAG TPA: hypothetical protein VG842_05065 [Sediminibacterium sp.]|nr:hypothetical protein [Sediminibacterium sp.]
MATQTGVIQLSGKLDKQVYYQRNGKNFARKVQESHQLTENSRKSGKEFGRASAAASMVQKAFSESLGSIMDNECFLRLTSCFGEVIRTAYHKPKGERDVTDGDLALLNGFQLSRYISGERILPQDPVVGISPETKLKIALHAFPTDPRSRYKPARAETLVVRLYCGVFHFAKKQGKVVPAVDLEIKLEEAGYFKGGVLDFPVTEINNRVLIIAAAYHFLDEDGKPINNRKYRAGKILAAALVRNWKPVPFRYPAAQAPELQRSGKAPTAKGSWTLHAK